jgi:hypothetical protein
MLELLDEEVGGEGFVVMQVGVVGAVEVRGSSGGIGF